MVRLERIERSTPRLKVTCSTTELQTHLVLPDGVEPPTSQLSVATGYKSAALPIELREVVVPEEGFEPTDYTF